MRRKANGTLSWDSTAPVPSTVRCGPVRSLGSRVAGARAVTVEGTVGEYGVSASR